MTKIVCISDTHAEHRLLDVPDGDILIHSGDFTNQGEHHEVASFANWLDTLPHKHKIVVPGNHDKTFEDDLDTMSEVMKYSCTLLIDNCVIVEGMRIWGSPWTPNFFPEHWVYNHDGQGPHANKVYAEMCRHTPDIVVSHGPPYGIADEVERGHVGCHTLLKYLEKLRPKLVVCGHIHEGYGTWATDFTTVVNASCMTGNYRLKNPPIVINI